MQQDLMIGLDLGTTTVKAVAVDVAGKVTGGARGEAAKLMPREGWVTQDARAYWKVVCEVLSKTFAAVEVERVTGLCLSGAMHSLLLIDEHDEPLADAMLWADGRGQAQAAAIRRELDPRELHQRTGCPVRWQYHPARLRWWRECQPQAADKAKLFTSLKDWIGFKLTGQWRCDAGLMSCTGLVNLRQLTWDAQAIEAAGIKRSKLPPLGRPHERYGSLTEAAAEAVGWDPRGQTHDAGQSASGAPRVPVIMGGSDGALANLGAAGGQPGQVVVTVGTSGAIRMLTSQPAVDARETTWCYLLADNLYVRGGAINNGGLTPQWLADRLYEDRPPDERHAALDRDAAAIAPGAEGVLLLPYYTGERTPLWDATLRASIHGLSLSHKRPHLGRAGLEAVAFSLAEVWDAVGLSADAHPTVRLTGGITQSTLWRQIVADVLGVELEVSQAGDASAVGAARLGHWALGHVESLAAFGPIASDATVRPNPQTRAAYQDARRRFRRLTPR